MNSKKFSIYITRKDVDKVIEELKSDGDLAMDFQLTNEEKETICQNVMESEYLFEKILDMVASNIIEN